MRVQTTAGYMMAVTLTMLSVVPCALAGNVCTWTGSWSPLTPVAGDDIVIQSGNLTWGSPLPAIVASWSNASGAGTVTFQTVFGTNGFTNFTVNGNVTLSGGAWTHTVNTTGETNRLRVTVNGNLFVTNASITADALGYNNQTGPGAGSVNSGTVCGGAYGGVTPGNITVVNANKPYGSIVAPTNLGSGGGGDHGGGAILLTVAGTTTVASAGYITANGGAGGTYGGGSGGSIYLTTGWLVGTGTIRANGATDPSLSNYGGGSGGRVAIVLTGSGADFSTTYWNGTNTAFGYGGSSVSPAAAGTVYLKTATGAGTLLIDNNNVATYGQQIVTLLPDAVNLNSFSNVVIRNKGVLGVKGDTTLDFNTFRPTVYGIGNSYVDITSDTNVTYPTNWTWGGYTVYGEGISKALTNVIIATNGALSHCPNGASETYKLNLTITGNLTVLSNGMLTADACGYGISQGTGRGVTINGYSEGGAYGGVAMGYFTAGPNTNKPYGSVTAPSNLGSGGGGAVPNAGGPGGGAIVLTVAGTTTVYSTGMISANGGTNITQGGGSGGSVYLTTGWLSGSGSIQANGGKSPDYSGGSGGRVAIILTGPGADFTTLWSGTNSAYGGPSAYASAAGTVYLKTPTGVDTLIVDNNGTAVWSGQIATLMPDSVNLNNFSNVVIRNKGVLGVKGNTVLDFNTFPGRATLYGAANSYIALDADTGVTYPANWTIDGYTLYGNAISRVLTNLTIGTNGALSHYQNNTNEAYKLNLAINGNLTILTNGMINADGVGYWGSYGPGKPLISAAGGAYGGGAVGNSNTYGFVMAPTNLGSGGGNGSGSKLAGGGAILLTVGGTTTVTTAGIISANGGSGNYYGGSGGSVYLNTGWLTGSGTIRADGGVSPSGFNAGGGGRVAIVLTSPGATFASWTGTNRAYGGAGSSNPKAAAGTVYRKTADMAAGAGTVIVDNGTTATNSSFTSLPGFTNSTENIAQTVWVTTNNVRLGVLTNAAIASLTLNANGYLELNGYTLTVKALTVTNKVCKSGAYGPHDTPISVLTDAGSGGKVVVNAGKGTALLFR